MIANSDAFHVPHTLMGLKYNKVIFIEKPMALSLKDADSIIELEKHSSGKVMVGYMRRYAAGFLDAVKEIGSLDNVHYARVRDIVGPNSAFVGQSGTFPKTFSDYTPEDSKELSSRTSEFLEQALSQELGIPVTSATALQWRHLGSLGSHDLSAMREALGMPTAVLGASLCATKGPPFWRYVCKLTFSFTFITNFYFIVVLFSSTLLSLSHTSLVLTKFPDLMRQLRSLVVTRP